MVMTNAGTLDRWIRGVAGVVLLIIGESGSVGPVLTTVFDLLGLALITSAAVGWCPLYRLLRMDTLPRKV